MTERTHTHDRQAPHGSSSRCCNHRTERSGGLSRRRVLSGAIAVAGTGLAGCLEDDAADEPPAEPVALTDGQSCDVCGMVIEDHYGPAGQLFYADGNPDERDGPAWFDSVAELVVYHEERVGLGWELREGFVTDYSSVDYDLEERDGTTYISSHVAADDFADATELHYVVDSDVEGAMGEDLLPFSTADDAAAFADEHGGTVREWTALLE
ncbi:nitrous oxide reductase accessory protein NosL [Natronobacterium texcoconense]|uniref:Nitrous oxide reductase accessory protein NosL n=1 Tax=Natronobacterium texcoconense TaxID=1095778 RepID=A0A1H0Z0G2_NATTX|nr:nitrous oxide reductase accessory protein NosL [Natronobacterium texcoconense]SDQ20848.1 Nitrous oxide reductase accessory protein NosL [Natronobacterium texcoconense]